MSVHKDITNQKELNDFLQAHGGVAVIDFHATWCGPCVRIAPYVESSSAKHGIPYVKVDVDEADPSFTQGFGVTAMPTFAVVDLSNPSKPAFTKVGGSEAVVNEIFAAALQAKAKRG